MWPTRLLGVRDKKDQALIPLPQGSILPADPPLERGKFFQSLIDVCALLAFALIVSALASGVGLLAFAYLGSVL